MFRSPFVFLAFQVDYCIWIFHRNNDTSKRLWNQQFQSWIRKHTEVLNPCLFFIVARFFIILDPEQHPDFPLRSRNHPNVFWLFNEINRRRILFLWCWHYEDLHSPAEMLLIGHLEFLVCEIYSSTVSLIVMFGFIVDNSLPSFVVIDSTRDQGCVPAFVVVPREHGASDEGDGSYVDTCVQMRRERRV